jgi:hypothetical protein
MIGSGDGNNNDNSEEVLEEREIGELMTWCSDKLLSKAKSKAIEDSEKPISMIVVISRTSMRNRKHRKSYHIQQLGQTRNLGTKLYRRS